MPSFARLRTLVLVALAFCACGGGAAPPNIVMIIADDQAFTDFGFMGSPIVQTPNLDRLASESARFPSAYVPTAMCRPSLATLLTGLFPHQHGVYFNLAPGQQAAAEHAFRELGRLPEMLLQAGYASFQTGKFWEGHHSNGGFSAGMTRGEEDALAGDPALGAFTGPFGDHGLRIGREGLEPIGDFLDGRGGEPFFLWYAPLMPHIPSDAPAEFEAPYRGLDLPPGLMRYFAMCSRFDASVGDLLDMLERRGLTQDTLVVFVADNGYRPGSHWPYFKPRTKASPFEMGVRTPLLLRWPGHIPAASHDAPVSTVDVMPTLLDAAGLAPLAKGLPGESLWPVIEGREPLGDRPVFGEEYAIEAETLGDPQSSLRFRWVRSGPWKLIVPEDGPPMLFRVADDPLEERDLAASSEWSGVRSQLEAMLEAWWQPRRG